MCLVRTIKVFLLCASASILCAAEGVRADQTLLPLAEEDKEYLSGTVDPTCNYVKIISARSGSPEAAYYYVRDNVDYDPHLGPVEPKAVIKKGRGSCFSKAALLCSIYRHMGASAEQVHVVLGEVEIDGENVLHAWVELKYLGGKHLIDPSGLIGTFDFAEIPHDLYHQRYVTKAHIAYNDAGVLPLD